MVGLEGAKPAQELLDKLETAQEWGRKVTAISNDFRRLKGVCELSREIGVNQRRLVLISRKSNLT